MTTETRNTNQPESKSDFPVTFKCRFCGEIKPLREMRRIDRFFPPVVACAGCEKRMDRAVETVE